MRKLISLFVTLAAFSSIAYSQNTGQLSGKIQSGNAVIANATVSILKLKDSSVQKMSVSDKAGIYAFDRIPFGKYFLRATAVGYQRFSTKPFTFSADSNDIKLPAIELKELSKDLQTVQVTATRPLIENKIDKLVVNVEAAISNAGSTAMDVLEKSPGVMVDKDGNISLKGKQGVIILVDGKQTYLSSTDLATFLKNTPANQLDQIEIMSQPSAKYDASGNSGMINIKTKKNQQQGYNGSLSLSYTQGKYARTNNSFLFNRRKGKVNLFGTAGVSYNNNFFNIDLLRKITNQSTGALTSVFDQHTYNLRHDQPNNIKAGIDIFASKKTTVGAVVNFTYLNAGGSGESSTNIYNGSNKLNSINTAFTEFQYDWHNWSGNINLRQIIDTSGKEITADLDYVSFRKTNPGHTDNYTYDALGHQSGDPFLLHISTPSNIDIYTVKADYVHPIKKIAKLEAGFKSSYVKTDNIADYTYYDFPTLLWKIDSRTNRFQYDENINAAYINGSKQVAKWGFQLGLRAENTNAKGQQITTNQNFEKHYTQLFLTTYVSYSPDKKNTFALSYGRRIDRPNYQDMNPFRYFMDKYSYREGNPNLTPQFTQNVELSHNYKGQLNTSINYTRTTDIITDVFSQNDVDSSIAYKRQNLATQRNIGLSVNYNKAFNKVWTFSFFLNAYNNYFEGIINNAHLDITYTSFQININNQLKMQKGWSAEIGGLYRYKSLDASSINDPNGMVMLGVAKQIMKNKGTVRLNVRDPFYTNYWHSVTKFDNIDMNTTYKFDSRQVALAFTYRFGKNQSNVPQRKRTSASQEEQNRAGQGNN